MDIPLDDSLLFSVAPKKQRMTAILTDLILHQAITDIIYQSKVSRIVETGTNIGDGTLALFDLCPDVVTCEINDEYADISRKRFVGKNIQLCRGPSDDILDRNLAYWCKQVGDEHSVLIVLDAHWLTDWPLLGELKAINTVRQQGFPVTVLIDDFFVENRPNFVGCYGGLRSSDVNGRESELTPCGYNPPFSAELDRFPHCIFPDYRDPTIGYGIFSDFRFDLGNSFKVKR